VVEKIDFFRVREGESQLMTLGGCADRHHPNCDVGMIGTPINNAGRLRRPPSPQLRRGYDWKK
jgi:hypothetical protein